MSQTPEDHRRAHFQGESFIASHLVAVVHGGSGLALAESYAGGIAEGVCAFLKAFVSDRAAYDALQAAADRAAAPRVTGTSGAPEEAS